MTNQPELIVDPSGRVQDVRYQKWSQESGSPPPHRPDSVSAQHRMGGRFSPQSRQKSKTPRFVPIPVGLIVAIIVYLCRLFDTPTASVDFWNTDSASLEFGLGTRCFDDGEYGKVIADLVMATGLPPEEISTMLHQIPISAGLRDVGLVNHIDGTRSFANSSLDYANRGRAYLISGEYDKAIALQPDLAMAYYYRGVASCFTGDYEKAVTDFEQVLGLDNNPPVQQAAEHRLQTLGFR